MNGFPPPEDDRVTLANWQDAPYNVWAFSHLRELVPTQRVRRSREYTATLPTDYQHIRDVTLTRIDGTEATADDVIATTYTDALVVLHNGHIVTEAYYNETEFDTPHLLMSVTKSLVGTVAGILIDQGLLSPDEYASHYVPELEDSGYAGATVRNILDMRSGIKFSEEYTDPEAEVRVMEQAFGWTPAAGRTVPGSIYNYLTTLEQKSEHGGKFEYRSCETLALGWICERAAGSKMNELLSTLIWAPMGADWDAELTCDPIGTGIHDGGLCTTARDLARFGQVILDSGVATDGTRIVPEEWIRSLWAVDPDIRQAFDDSDAGPHIPGGWYRNQFWFIPRPHGDVMLGLGINGQMLYISPGTRTVGVKFSAWPTAQDGVKLHDTIRMFDAMGDRLAGLAPARASHEGPPGIAAGLSR